MANQGALALIVTIFASIAAMGSASSLVTFVFGDSLTDVGNNNFLQYSLAKSNYPWYGIDFNGGQATGRFTNGRTIGDILSTKLGIQSPPPYLSLSQNDDRILKGVNYASGGAGILNETGQYFLQRLTFDDQITSFEKNKEAIKAKIGEQATNKLLNEAIYFVGMGSNDYVNNFLQPFMADGQQYTHEAFVDLLISTLDKQIKRLYNLGARKLVFTGIGPLGCIPSQRAKSKQGGCLLRVNQWVSQFNAQVQKLLLALNPGLPGTEFTFADTYPVVLDLIMNPHSYGNTNTTVNDNVIMQKLSLNHNCLLIAATQASRTPTLRAAMSIQPLEDCVCLTQSCAETERNSYFGMHSIPQKLQTRC
ncbi:hypothetical protein Scep_022788 [Stephania cephalantha]|uniref:Uncharacterized protein n=1 Tax=Stephania cephalantha TaxID=152367 RepID=A0AAP0I2X6_9MAGN